MKALKMVGWLTPFMLFNLVAYTGFSMIGKLGYSGMVLTPIVLSVLFGLYMILVFFTYLGEYRKMFFSRNKRYNKTLKESLISSFSLRFHKSSSK